MKHVSSTKRDITYSNTHIKGRYQSFVLTLNFYLPCLSAKQLSKECHPDPQPPREAMLPSHPTPPPPPALTPASCSVALVVSVLVVLFDVSGKRDGGWGQQCGMLFLQRQRVGGGGGWRLSSSGLPPKHSEKTKQHLGNVAFLNAEQCVYKLLNRVGTASLVGLVNLSGET